MPAYVKMYRQNFQPGRMCDDPDLLYAGQVVTDGGTVLARASRIYNQWFWTGPDGVSRLLDHPNNPPVIGDEAVAARHAALTAELINHLVAIAKGYNNNESEAQA